MKICCRVAAHFKTGKTGNDNNTAQCTRHAGLLLLLLLLLLTTSRRHGSSACSRLSDKQQLKSPVVTFIE